MIRAATRHAGDDDGETIPRDTPSRVKPRRSRGGRSQELPGLEGARNQRLDNIAEALVEERDRLNSAKVEEQALIMAALKEMQDADLQV